MYSLTRAIFLLTVFSAAVAAAAPLQVVCERSGVQGYSEFSPKLSGDAQLKYLAWETNTLAQSLAAPSLAPEFYSICPLGSGCSTFASWYFAMNPQARLRREAVFVGLNAFAPNLRHWSEVRAEIERRSKPNALTDAARLQIQSLATAIRAPHNSAMISLWSHALCLKSQAYSLCTQGMAALNQVVHPRLLTRREWPALSPDAPPLTLAVPDALERLLLEPRYLQTLRMVNLALLEDVDRLEAAPGQVPGLESVLDQALEQVFAGESKSQLHSRKLDILLLYGSRGASFLGLRNYLPKESDDFLFQYGAFSTLINYVDVLSLNFLEGSAGCLQSKPYHQIFSRALVEYLVQHGQNPKAAAEATLLMAFSYRLLSQSPMQISPDLIRNKDSNFYENERLDLVMSTIGILRGLGQTNEFDQEAALRAMGSSDENARAETFSVQDRAQNVNLSDQIKGLYEYAQIAHNLGLKALLEILRNMDI